jgi:ornithine cyclodeaminase/alanine dehydrogenase
MGFSEDVEPGSILFLSDNDVAKLSAWAPAIQAIRSAYSMPEDDKRMPGRIFAHSEKEWLRIMPAIPESGRLFGYKSIAGSFRENLHVSYLISLFDKETAGLVALLDGNRVTGLRTAATTAVGVQSITSDLTMKMGIIGSGFEAQSHLEAIATQTNIGAVNVFSPTPANRELFAAKFNGKIGSSVSAVGSAEEAASEADLLLCAARSADESPTVQADWVSPTAAVISIGSTTPAQRELPIELIDRASVIVVDSYEEVVHGSGDLLEAQKAGIDVASKIIPLSDAVRGLVDLASIDGIRIYKSTGTGLQDIVVAEMLFNEATAAGLGTTLPTGIVTSKK